MSEDAGGSTTQGCEGFAPEGCTEPLDEFFPFGLEGTFLLPTAAESVDTFVFMVVDSFVSIVLGFHVRVRKAKLLVWFVWKWGPPSLSDASVANLHMALVHGDVSCPENITSSLRVDFVPVRSAWHDGRLVIWLPPIWSKPDADNYRQRHTAGTNTV